MSSLRSSILPVATLFIAATGGMTAGALGVPAGHLLGAFLAVLVAALSGLPTRIPPRLIDCAFVSVGLILGSSVTPELLSQVSSWPITMAFLCASALAAQIGVQFFLSRVAGWDEKTAFFAAFPGALSYVVAMAARTDADFRKVVVAQSLRVLLIMTTVPALLIGFHGTRPVVAANHPMPWDVFVAVALIGAGVGLLLNRARFPGGLMIGALIASAALHGGGIVVGSVPQPVVMAAFILLGGYTGSRFAGTTVRALAAMALPATGAFIVGVVLSMAFALMAWATTGTPLEQLILAFMPGGMEIMVLLAFAFNLDPAYVGAHQLARFMLIAFGAPALVRLMIGKETDTDIR